MLKISYHHPQGAPHLWVKQHNFTGPLSGLPLHSSDNCVQLEASDFNGHHFSCMKEVQAGSGQSQSEPDHDYVPTSKLSDLWQTALDLLEES